MATSKPRGSFDTNVLLRYVLNDVPAQTRAVEELLAHGGSYVVEDAALIEMVFVLEKLYGMPREAVIENILSVMQHPQLVCDARVFEEALAAYAAHGTLSFMDCVLAAYASVRHTAPLYTFDKALAAKLQEHVTRIA
jgi:predicted nucleic-acid-binding protein